MTQETAQATVSEATAPDANSTETALTESSAPDTGPSTAPEIDSSAAGAPAGKAGNGLNLTIAKKIPGVIVGCALILAVAMGISDFMNSSSAIKESVSDGLVAQQEARATALNDYLGTIREDLGFTASNPTAINAVQDFTGAWNILGGDPTGRLQKLYIEDNPHPTGSKENLDFAPDGSYYSDVHAKYHPWFREFLRARGYYDIFLFNMKGDLVYSVYKELDYATNLNTGEWKDTDLGNAFRSGLTGEEAFYDFKPYAPSNDAPASFMSRPIFDSGGETVGVLVFQMPIDRLNAVMQVTAGMGETGETYIVGGDHLMRSDSRFSEESTILSREVATEPVERALNGETGLMSGDDYRGVEVMSAYSALDFMGTR